MHRSERQKNRSLHWRRKLRNELKRDGNGGKQELPITIVLFDNDVLGMVRQWQTIFYDCHYSQTILDRKTDFPALAKAFGADGYAVYTMEDPKESP